MKRKVILTVVALLTAIVAEAQAIPWEIEEELHPVIYPFTIDPKTANAKYNDVGTHAPLSEEYGYVIIPPSAYRQKEDHGGSLGILVAHIPGDVYVACELRCARCLYEYKQHNKMTPIKPSFSGHVCGIFECKHCGAQLGSFVFTGNSGLDHYEYQSVHVLGQEGYCADKIYDDYGYIKELRITNPINMIEHLERKPKSRKQLQNVTPRELFFDYCGPENEFK